MGAVRATLRWGALTLTLAIALAAAPRRAYAEVPADAGSARPPAPFSPGEQSTYDVSFLGVRAGTAEVTVGWATRLMGRDVWPIVCVGRTSAAADVAYPIADRFVSYWDPLEARAVAADLLADENRVRRRERYVFDLPSGTIAATRERQGAPPTERRFAAPPDVTDLAAAAFKLRSQALTVGSELSLPVFLGSRLSRVGAKVEALETLSTRLGAVEVYRVSLEAAFAGGLAPRSRIRAYLTADARRLPVRLEADFLLGAIVIDLRAHLPGIDG